jgi:K+-transporting ATPase A subunit
LDNTTGAITMLVGRFMMIIPMLASPATPAQKKGPVAGTPGDTPAVHCTLLGVVIVGALTFPALSPAPSLSTCLAAVQDRMD